jgi:type VI secretion system protein ImpJ
VSDGTSDIARVVWSEGMFLRQHHFQQQDRWIEHQLAAAVRDLVPGVWGVRRLRLDEGLLEHGRVGIAEAELILPDGTVVAIGASAAPPEPLAVGPEDGCIYVALPLRQEGVAEIDGTGAPRTGLRLRGAPHTVRDSIAGAGTMEEPVEVALPALVLLRENDPRDRYAALAIARVKSTTDLGEGQRRVTLDDQFVVPTTRFDASPPLESRVRDLVELLAASGEDLVAWVRGKRSGSGSERDLLMLQAVNRAELELRHLRLQGQIHPERLYCWLLGLLGELSTFARESRRPPRPEEVPPYRHEAPTDAFQFVFKELSKLLATRIERRAVRLDVQLKRPGAFVVQTDDRSLLTAATLHLVVGAATPLEDVYQGFPKAATIGPINEFQGLIDGQLRGIAAEPLRHLPDGLPSYPGRAYFRLDRQSPYWAALPRSPGMGILVIGPLADSDLEIECWAIRD